MFAIDTNILVYAHNQDAPWHRAAAAFLEKSLNHRDHSGRHQVCLPSQVIMEFVNVVTKHALSRPLSLIETSRVVQNILNTGVEVVSQKPTQLHTFLQLLENAGSRRNIFDMVLAATLKDNGIDGLYTANVDDFKGFAFLQVINPLK